MMNSSFNSETNNHNLTKEIEWLGRCFEKRIHEFQNSTSFDFTSLTPPILTAEGSPYASFIHENSLTASERILTILSFIPFINPGFLSAVLPEGNNNDRLLSLLDFHFFDNRAMPYPSFNTALYLLGGTNINQKYYYHTLLTEQSELLKNKIIYLDPTNEILFPQSKVLKMDTDMIDLLWKGYYTKPSFSMEFPAEELNTNIETEDLILYQETLSGIDQIMDWIHYETDLYSNNHYFRKVKPGARVLFWGDPGTGKTESAALLGKRSGKTVYRIDLSKIISKYIGETEKNLGRLFDKAQNKGWILFFDEGDALFGKRTTKTESANDLHANQQISYLLQRIETFNGLVILSTNLKENIDAAFIRRFDIIVPFYKPGGENLVNVWRNAFPPEYTMEETIDWHNIATYPHYAFSPAEITNIMKYVVLRLCASRKNTVTYPLLMEGIRNEMAKKGQAFTQPQTTLPTAIPKPAGTSISTTKTSLSQTTGILSSPALFSEEDLLQMSDAELNERCTWMVNSDKRNYHDRIQLIVNELIRRKNALWEKNFMTHEHNSAYKIPDPKQ